MAIRSKVLGLVAALGLVISAFVPALAQTSESDTGIATITLTDDGIFAVIIDDATLTGFGLTASTGGTGTGNLNISYTDTKTFRGGFFLTLNATDFLSQTKVTPRAYFNNSTQITLPAGVPYRIPAINFDVVKNYNVVQGRFSFATHNTLGYAIGDIGSTPSGIFPNLGDSTSGFDGGGTGGPTAFHTWTDAESNSLSTTPRVSRGLPGPGTAGGTNPNGSTHKLDVELIVPTGQPADTYKSTLTITVIPGIL